MYTMATRTELSRQLRAQYVEGIYDNPVTLKYRLTVTQGHWKRNHGVDHLFLSSTTYYWSSYWTLNITVTLKCGSVVTQGH